MDWSNEEYVRLYTRETADDLDLSWEATALWRAMLTKFDRSGVLSAKNGWASVANLTRMPRDVVERVGPELVKDGRIKQTKTGFYAPNYIEAQTASKSDKIRQRESRDKRRLQAISQGIETANENSAESQPVTPGHTESHAGHAPSQNVTLCSAEARLSDTAAEAILGPSPNGSAEIPGDLFDALVDKTNAATGEVGAQRAKPVLEERKQRKAREAKGPPDHQPAVDAFHEYFVAAHGTKPTWDPTRISMVKTLVSKHTCGEVVRCIGVLRDSPPKFPPPPWDLPTFVLHFDKCRGSPLVLAQATGRVEPRPAEQYGDGDQEL